ncbi:hypothetical protein [Pseudomonas gingeri]|uniref:Peptidase M48 domain-containing protein n=1 Tax=Pseudomonas gingeri TaxID=117681 RepID=A0A7Y8BIF3_9PSED|nr:hypothetical protein [Pseudomonas gingeri]NWB44865.1 hypothetical protein [Pseudomonas gingeri]
MAVKKYDRDPIASIYESYFGINTQTHCVKAEIIRPTKDPEGFQRIKEQYEEHLKSHSNREAVAKRLYVSDHHIIHLQAVFPVSDLEDLQEESSFYYPICTVDEIKRIENPVSAEDILLRIRAEDIANHPRVTRTFLKRRELHEGEWSLTGYYRAPDFHRYLRKLTSKNAEICRSIPAGFAPSREPHGYCLKTNFGKLVVVSEPLKHFLYNMYIFMFGGAYGVSRDDTFSAFIIASRTMLLTEAQDFDLDPRSENLPEELQVIANEVVRDQLQFIIGHEYAHALLGHHEASSAVGITPKHLFSTAQMSQTWYTPSQKNEFEADAASILQATYRGDECADVLNGATLYFLQLELYYVVAHYINPQHNRSSTHPDPIDRIWALRKAVREKTGLPQGAFTDEEVQRFIDEMSGGKRWLENEYLPFYIESFEDYGSVYLEESRGTPRVDRFDY